jgi:hypothetical protein
MRARSHEEIQRIWTNVDGLKKLSDRVVGVGPFGLGLDGLLTWIPGAGDAYTVGVGGWLVLQAMRAHASPKVIARMVTYLAADTATAAVPFAGAVVDTLFPAHLMAAKALQKEMDATHYVRGTRRQAEDDGSLQAHLDKVRMTKGKKRVVFLDN